MGRNLKLLPHWCQIIGYTYIIGLLSCFAFALVDTGRFFPEDCGIINGIDSFYKYALTHWTFVGAVNFIMIFVAIFSKEKVEDEMTTAIRINTLLYLVFFIFAIHILVQHLMSYVGIPTRYNLYISFLFFSIFIVC